MNKLAKIIKETDYDSLLLLRKDVLEGNMLRIVDERIAQFENPNRVCPVCNAAINPGCYGTDPDDLTLANSLYLAAKPAWMCAETSWPPVNPATPSMSDIPEKIRYGAGTCTLGEGAPAPPTKLVWVRR